MKTSAVALAACAALASANPFTLIAARSASPIHLQPIHANGEALWIGKATAQYCPEGNACSSLSNETALAYGSGGLSMDTEVAGGQQVFIDPKTGAVGYTIAHSSAEPTGAIVNGWTLAHGDSYDTLSWKHGVLFCSQAKSANHGPWKMYAAVKGVKFGANCLGASLIASNVTGPAAWQYTK